MDTPAAQNTDIVDADMQDTTPQLENDPLNVSLLVEVLQATATTLKNRRWEQFKELTHSWSVATPATAILVQPLHLRSPDLIEQPSYLFPGQHGYLLVASENEPHVYQFRMPVRIFVDGLDYGVYLIRPSPPSLDMTGAEFLTLSDRMKVAIVEARSKSKKGTREFELVERDILTSGRTNIPCCLLECLEQPGYIATSEGTSDTTDAVSPLQLPESLVNIQSLEETPVVPVEGSATTTTVQETSAPLAATSNVRKEEEFEAIIPNEHKLKNEGKKSNRRRTEDHRRVSEHHDVRSSDERRFKTHSSRKKKYVQCERHIHSLGD